MAKAWSLGMKEKRTATHDNKNSRPGADLLAAFLLSPTPIIIKGILKTSERVNSHGSQRIDALTQLSERDVTAANMLGMGNLIPDQLTQVKPQQWTHGTIQSAA